MRQIAALYTSDAQTVALAAGAMALCAIFYLPDGMQVVVAQALRARGDVLVPTFTHLASYLVVMLPLAYCAGDPDGLGHWRHRLGDDHRRLRLSRPAAGALLDAGAARLKRV